ncbi:hypothetical protein [Bradyrhizobium sp. WSM471]|uniref:hypothetical protein n=1 Tax=Bradyrhizobium sp. WSM471 TaxID=319017 RepID=UPI0012F8FDEE|nr:MULTISPECIES: hypothetical protein [Bradyrhizobium]UFW43166.1 hypothetical protein BcanWSM471_08785 [Bradyrhizobium canariense]
MHEQIRTQPVEWRLLGEAARSITCFASPILIVKSIDISILLNATDLNLGAVIQRMARIGRRKLTPNALVIFGAPLVRQNRTLPEEFSANSYFGH